MSDEENEDEFDQGSVSETESDDEYEQNLKKEAEKLKTRRMQARPSTIVQVSTGPLEFHLQSMKKQLKEHAVLINHPPFLDDLMIEVNKISGLVRKIEHCQQDINNVRETMAGGLVGSSTGTGQAIELVLQERVNHLFKDLEMVRGVLRRVDVHHALDATVLVRVKNLAKNLKALKDYSEKMFTKNMQGIQDELRGELKSVNSRMQQIDELHSDKLGEVFDRIKKTEESIHEGQKEETEILSKKVEFLEENLTTDFYSFKGQVDENIKTTKLLATKAFMEVSRGSLSSGMKLIDSCIRNVSLEKVRRRFQKWQNFDPQGWLARGRSMINLTKRAHRKMFLRDALFEWKRYHNLQESRQKMKDYMASIIQKWRDKAFPMVFQRFQTWKRYCVFMKFHILERKAVTNNSSSLAPPEDKEKYSNEEYDSLIENINPSNDIKGSFQLTGLYVDRIYKKISKMHEELHTSNETTRRIGHRVEGVRGDLMEVLDNRCGEVEKQQRVYSKKLSSSIKDIKESHEDFEKSTAKSFTKSTTEVSRLEMAVYDLTMKVDDQTNRLERLFSLHQKMLNRIDTIEVTQKKHDAQMEAVNSAMSMVSEKNAKNDAEMMLLKHMTEKSMIDLKDEFVEVKSMSADASRKLQAVLSNQSQEHTTVVNLSKDLKSKISGIESWLNTTAPKPPSPKVLVALALKFEDRAVEKHCQDPAHTFTVSMSTELAKDIATCAHWLVYHIVEATDVDVLTRIMKGPQDIATVYDNNDPSNALDSLSSARLDQVQSKQKSRKNGTLTHEEFCATTRESMLLRYLEAFQKQLNQSRDEVGIVRKEARSMFLKRFIDALDLSLQKQDAIVLTTPSALGRNPGHATGRSSDNSGPAACMACDRPLRMRTTTRSIGELYEKLLLSGKKSSEVKREVMRNQILTPQNAPTSPHHNYRFESDCDPLDKSKPTYSMNGHNYDSTLGGGSNRNNQDIEDFQRMNTVDEVGQGRKGQSIVRIKPAHTSRPQSAPKVRMTSSQSASQLNKTPHYPSPSKGGGFKGMKSFSQEALVSNLAHDLPVDTTIPPRHTIDDLPSSSRPLLGIFEQKHHLNTSIINDSIEEIEGKESSNHVMSSSSGLKGSFRASSRPKTADSSGSRN